MTCDVIRLLSLDHFVIVSLGPSLRFLLFTIYLGVCSLLFVYRITLLHSLYPSTLSTLSTISFPSKNLWYRNFEKKNLMGKIESVKVGGGLLKFFYLLGNIYIFQNPNQISIGTQHRIKKY